MMCSVSLILNFKKIKAMKDITILSSACGAFFMPSSMS